MRKFKYWWIKERHNPQLGVYYSAMGQMAVASARGYEAHVIYGTNYMHRFTSQKAYENELAKLRAEGKEVL